MFSFLKKTPPPAPADVPAVAPAAAPPQPDAKPTAAPSWRERLFQGLARTRAQWGGKLKSVFARGKVDDELLEELETLLLTSDVGIEATTHLLDELKKAAKRDKRDTPESIQAALADALHRVLLPLEQPLDVSTHSPYVIMIAGVNGAGKTTSIGKLAKYFQSQGKSVLLAAGDTFRAAARPGRRPRRGARCRAPATGSQTDRSAFLARASVPGSGPHPRPVGRQAQIRICPRQGRR